MDSFASERFCHHEPGLFQWIYQAILAGGDPYRLLADFESYVATHDRLAGEYTEAPVWWRKSVLNVARGGEILQ
jgi:starch phosphorylase